jgi:hypothetical protein
MDDVAFRAIEAILRDHAAFPLSATLPGLPVIVEGIEYLGPRLGITASVVRRNRRHRVSMLELEFPPELAIYACQDAYRRWAEGEPLRPDHGTPPRDAMRDCGRLHVSGSKLSHRFEAKRLGLRYQGEWDPQEFLEQELGGTAERDIPHYYLPILAVGLRPEYEMDQVIPGLNPSDDDDPIVMAADMNRCGDRAGARHGLMGLLAEDPRCVDAYAHLGYFDIGVDPEMALRYYRAGMDIAELSLPAGFNGVLPWSHLDNRPYLRCLHGAGLCHWRLEGPEEAQEAFERMPWLSPRDNQGAAMLIEDVRAGRPWQSG